MGLLGAPVGSVDVEGASTSGLHSCLQDLGYGGVPGGGLSESAQSSWLCTCMLVWVKGTSWRNCRPKRRKTLFPFVDFFLIRRYSLYPFLSLVLWCMRIGRARHPGPWPAGYCC